MENMSKADEIFIKHVSDECNKHNVILDLSNKKYLILKYYKYQRVVGFFDTEKLRVATAVPYKLWFSTLIHEYSHMRQWIEQRPIWKKYLKTSQKNILRHNKINRQLEIDCEKQAAQYIDKYNLSINKKEYIKNANIHIFSYTWGIINRQECFYVPDDNNILNIIPDFFLEDYSSIPKKIERVLDEYYI